jgi:Nif-specific regulatory protein
MTPRLIAIAGPLEGMSFALDKWPVSLGRELDNQICVTDISVSRRHCAIRQQDEEFFVHDLGSRNATYVNGLPIKEHRLKTGDRIRLGDSIFMFLSEGEGTTDSPVQVQLNDGRVETGNTVRLRLPGQPDFKRVAELAARATTEAAIPPIDFAIRVANELNALLKLSVMLPSFRNAEALQQYVLQTAATIIPAERGALMLLAEDGETMASLTGWKRQDSQQAKNEPPLQISRTVVQAVLRDNTAILSNDVTFDSKWREASSLNLLQTTALLGAPMLAGEKVLGVIYFDALTPQIKFDEDHLELLRAIASLTAIALENLRRYDRLAWENQLLRAEMTIGHDLIGQSAKMREVYQFIGKAAPSEATVLIRGESGTGKELAARAIHQNSPRADKPFVAINCAALTESLLESELFGYEKGAFTGATAQKKGKIEVAQSGTLFLDEIGEMALPLQAKLLRVLQEREFERVGGTKQIKADIRILAATNRDLEQAIKDGRFREDLFYRLNVLTLKLPPLRERREDIKLLVNHFATKYAQKCKRAVKGIAPDALACLENYDWPGNVREFENTIERAIVLGASEMIAVEDLPEALISAKPAALMLNQSTSSEVVLGNFYDMLNETKKHLISRAVEQAKGNYTEAAKLLDIHPNHLHRLIRNLDMKGELLKFHS